MTPTVAVVIPTWNKVELTVRCLAALREQTFPATEVWIVDNASSDATVRVVRSEFPEVHVVELPSNQGFSAAVNVGIRQSTGDFVALLNNDTIADPRWLQHLVSAAETYPQVRLFASLMVRADDPTIVDAAGDGFSRKVWCPTSIGAGLPVSAVPTTPCWVTTPCAGAAMYRRTLFDEIGLFDEEFFLVFEDVDLGLRAQLAGHDTLFVPAAVVCHVRGASTNEATAEFVRRFFRNRLWVLVKNVPIRPLPAAVLRFLINDRHLRFSVWSARGEYARIPLHIISALARRRRVQAGRHVSWPHLRDRMVDEWRT